MLLYTEGSSAASSGEFTLLMFIKGETNLLFEILPDALLDAVLDTLKILPFLFLAYLLIEVLEHHAEEKTVALIHRAGAWGPAIGGALGIIPQCGFSAATANLFADGLITRGTLIAVFLSTSDEMLPILISKNAPATFILKACLQVCSRDDSRFPDRSAGKALRQSLPKRNSRYL